MFCEAFCLGDTTHPFEMKGMFFFMSIQLNQVNYSIGERTLIEISNLALPSQGVIGIVGKNGSGKTTLLKLIAGELPLDEGHITYSGEIETIQQFLDKFSIITSVKKPSIQCVGGFLVVFNILYL